MDPDKNTPPSTNEEPKQEQQAPADALSRTPDDLEQEEAAKETASPEQKPDEDIEKKVPGWKKFFRKVNVYLLLFVLIVIVAGAVTWVYYLNSQQVAPAPDIASQQLSEDELKELAQNDTSVGNASQTLTIQGNAVIAGQSLLRGNLSVAGTIQSGGNITAPGITISGDTNLGSTQIDSLQVAQNVAIQGDTTTRDLSVSGTSSFSGAMTASQITVTTLILSGNASLQVPNHISFPGASPSRSVTQSVLGNGGTASVNGSDTAGTVNIQTGNSPSAGCFIRVTFRQAFSNNPHVIVSPVNSAAGTLDYYVERDKSGFSVCSNNAAQANKAFAFDYFVTN